jgi:hypothetical protein
VTLAALRGGGCAGARRVCRPADCSFLANRHGIPPVCPLAIVQFVQSRMIAGVFPFILMGA